ncbi:MAG: hypothetical protein HC786_11505 [Richelia sp. CSU_2_1]|nr:hypothetical protein [Microcoleus sp. SM1_3_4]NJR22736.1 hypothetical protein [Richelia sp. CSU_2_1]
MSAVCCPMSDVSFKDRTPIPFLASSLFLQNYQLPITNYQFPILTYGIFDLF